MMWYDSVNEFPFLSFFSVGDASSHSLFRSSFVPINLLKRSIARRVGIQPTYTPVYHTSDTAQRATNNTTSTIIPNRMDDVFQSTFVVVIAGEYNAGKSTLINALVGSKLLNTGPIPTTDCMTILSSNNTTTTTDTTTTTTAATTIPVLPLTNSNISTQANTIPTSNETLVSEYGSPSSVGDVLYHPVSTLPLLTDMTIVDTPGTNAVLTDHTAMTLRILPAADLILFITSADRPFPESERTLLESIAVLHRKQIVIVINKMDIVEDTGGNHGTTEKRRVVQYVTEHASTLLGAQPIVIPISARDAFAAKVTGRVNHNISSSSSSTTGIVGRHQESVWTRSNFGTLERFLQETLTTESKIKSKLSSPIGVVEGVLDQCLHRLHTEEKEYETDISTLNLINSQFNAWKKELKSDMHTMTQEIQSVFINEGQRGSILLRRMHWKDLYESCLFDITTLRRECTMQQNDGDATHLVKDVVSNMARDMANSVALISRAQGQAMIEYLGKRPAMKNQTLLGNVTTASQYEDTRRNLHQNFMTTINKTVDMNEMELQMVLLKRLQHVVWLSTVANVASVCVAVTASFTPLLDLFTGWTCCTMLTVGSVVAWQLGNRNVIDQYATRWTKCGQQLDDDIQVICTRETERVCRRILDGITPYTLFIEAEQDRIQQLVNQCEGLNAKARQLRNRISDIS
jgi:tRNA U34 5-carboxymethylaminomethyl modifying GTPase MnmE/TrmE